MSDSDLAAREALEEAGVSGEISADPIGNFDYTKRLHLFSWVRCRVEVYLLHADRQLLTWSEKESRRCLWIEPQEAAKMVRERQVADLLRALPRQLQQRD